MPTGTPYNACIPPYRIRVDEFSSTTIQPTPLLHLLSHTHSDHLTGLSAKSFGYTVYCSEDAKQMLLRHEVYKERENREQKLRTQSVHTYSHLKVDPVHQPDGSLYYTGSRDLLRTIALERPTRLELSANEAVTITLLDANHCPGAVMFLVEGSKGAVLHTGDFRAEPWFIDWIKRNPFLQRYLYTEKSGPINKPLEAIYLDTACVLSQLDVPTKVAATTGLVELMKLFPESAYFFINTWTWGYEDILKAIAQAFQSKIHVDRYKYGIYQNLSDPYLRLITTQDPASTRFHACERFARCDHVAVENAPGDYSNAASTLGKRVIYINAVTMDIAKWERYMAETKADIAQGKTVNNLLVPLSRHSPLPELRAFVSLFRPRRIIPNTLDPRLQGLDWDCIDKMFADCLHPSIDLTSQNSQSHVGSSQVASLAEAVREDGDVALKNLVGEGVEANAAKWADGGKVREKLAIIRSFLGEDPALEGLLGEGEPDSPDKSSPARPGRTISMAEKHSHHGVGKPDPVSDEDTDDDSEEERGRTAHLLWGDPGDKENRPHGSWESSSPASQALGSQDVLAGLEEDELCLEGRPKEESMEVEAVGGETSFQRNRPLGSDGSSKLNMPTQSATPIKHRPQSLPPRQPPESPLATKTPARPQPSRAAVVAASTSNTPTNKSKGTFSSPIQLDSSPLPEKTQISKVSTKGKASASPARASASCASIRTTDRPKPISTSKAIGSHPSVVNVPGAGTRMNPPGSTSSVGGPSPLRRASTSKPTLGRTMPEISILSSMAKRVRATVTLACVDSANGGVVDGLGASPLHSPSSATSRPKTSPSKRPRSPSPPARASSSTAEPKARKQKIKEEVDEKGKGVARATVLTSTPRAKVLARSVLPPSSQASVSLLSLSQQKRRTRDEKVIVKRAERDTMTKFAQLVKVEARGEDRAVNVPISVEVPPSSSRSVPQQQKQQRQPDPASGSRGGLPLTGEDTIMDFKFDDSQDEPDIFGGQANGEVGGMNWARSMELMKSIREDVKLGRRPTVPPLSCIASGSQSQSQEGGESLEW